MRDIACWGVAAGLALVGACRAQAPEAAASREAARREVGDSPPHDAGALPFIRAAPPIGERRSVDACAFDSGGVACIDALVREPDPVRAKYMRRIARARVGRGAQPHAREEIAECCNPSGPCGAPKKSGHADCPAMDDGYACLVAAELGRDGAHARACRCDAERAQLPAPGGSLACDGARRVTLAPMPEADDVIACASCASAASCERELARVDADVADFIRRIIVTRCTLP